MKRKLNLLFFSIAAMLFLNACSSSSNASDADLFQYKGSYVGDNSAIVNTIIHLNGAKQFKSLELQTKEEPYGITVEYDMSESQIDKQQIAINNAAYLFTLIQNLDWVSFNFQMADGKDEIKITRKALEKWYEIELSEIKTEKDLKELIQDHFEDEQKAVQLIN
ncbi:DUF4825 domain-containing protein [Planococcus sp. CPCC 101016]|uniref:DUF4825 domain-containing protein n=1 Tax=Planococcus sp. CPCC 101016 TaxID=2599617 RepID=UPI0011B83510|nr:DUF4825 domain-containing protein [Planococcus sp. CPCC 101016]TWT08024.1 DUF4825 domain-containing protein [Planococcus sp. CPCC 101016]